ncbi:hypothetical protein CSOJ01_10991 [Colletotrichum sojae]|uniref:Uncharacterized protein n=1 Tax=Colletotrichum sojae TaxID=2175907 RepID=A0A8H6IYS8_9PEZI|nr:hypothetical protein CSOJ01_10991 [Colletotrichum sojae]
MLNTPVEYHYWSLLQSTKQDQHTDSLLASFWAHPWDTKDFSRLVRASAILDSIEVELGRNAEAMGVGSPTQILSSGEAGAWKSLQRSARLLRSGVDSILQTYMQVISVGQRLSANQQARQVGHLTSLATIFIHMSFVAAVFSMGGEFAAGEIRFWVF